MKEEIYVWMKNLAVFYILFTAVLYLVPDLKYQRYIRSFMGLLIIYMLCVPVFGLLGKGEELTEKFFYTFQQEMQEMKKLESEELQYFFLNEGYEQEAAGEIADFLQKSGINPVNTAVHIEGKQLFVELTFAQEISREQEGGIRDGLRESFGIAEENCQIYDGKNVGTAMDGSSPSGASSDSDRSSGEKRQ